MRKGGTSMIVATVEFFKRNSDDLLPWAYTLLIMGALTFAFIVGKEHAEANARKTTGSTTAPAACVQK